MKHKFKALGLALVAAFAMSAVIATGAQGEGNTKIDVSTGGSAVLTGTPITHDGSPHHSFNTFLGTITCEETVFHGTVTHGDTELTITPTYNTCTTNGFTTTVTMNGCDYTFKGGKATATAGHFENGTVKFDCPVGKAAEIHVYNSTVHNVGHTKENERCTYSVGPFDWRTGNTYLNTGSGATADIDITTTVSNVAVKRVFGSFFQCGSENQTSTYTGGTTLKAFKHKAGGGHTNEQVGISVTAN